MNEVLTFLQNYGVGIVIGCDGVLIAILIVCLKKVRATKKKLDMVTDCVQNYLSVIMDEESAEGGEEAKQQQKEPKQINMEETVLRDDAKSRVEEEQNRLISTVLQEIFP